LIFWHQHHRKEFLDSAAPLILAAAAARTQRIRLGSAVTVLSAADLFGYSRIRHPRSGLIRNGDRLRAAHSRCPFSATNTIMTRCSAA
jgi:hypothetical protein